MRVLRFLTVGFLALLAAGSAPAEAKVDVVTSDQNLSWLAKTIGGPNVSTEFLAGSGQDPHFVQPRPSQVARLSRADLVVRVGMDLDIWFDSLVRAAGNSKIVLGAAGYVDASQGIRALQVPQGKLDPSRGDIHIYGNPHYFYGPSNLPIAARNVRDGLKRVDPKNADAYDDNYTKLVQRLNAKMSEWKAKLAADRGKSVVTYHMSLIYFLTDFGMSEFGYVEPRPGLQPTPGHISSLAARMKQEGIKTILTEAYRPRRYADLVGSQSGASVVVLPGGIGAEKGADDYFAFMDIVVARVAAAL
jgi:zinc/manganese transport system substrate-binding protein